MKREGNSVAHNLAKYASNIQDFSIWMEDTPPPLLSVFSGWFSHSLLIKVFSLPSKKKKKAFLQVKKQK